MPSTFVPPALTINVDLLIVAGFIALLNVAVISAVSGHTGVEPFGGVTDVTVGGVVAHDVEVVKAHTFSAARGLPTYSPPQC